jgi:hypothetical protein
LGAAGAVVVGVVGVVATVGTLVEGVVTDGSSFSPQPDPTSAAAIPTPASADVATRILQ